MNLLLSPLKAVWNLVVMVALVNLGFTGYRVYSQVNTAYNNTIKPAIEASQKIEATKSTILDFIK